MTCCSLWYYMCSRFSFSGAIPRWFPTTNDVLFVFTPICFARGFMLHLCYSYLFTSTFVQHNFYIRWWSCRLSVTWRVSLVEQELLIFSSLRYLKGLMLLKSLVFCVMFCRSLFVLLYLRSEFRVVMSAMTSA